MHALRLENFHTPSRRSYSSVKTAAKESTDYLRRDFQGEGRRQYHLPCPRSQIPSADWFPNEYIRETLARVRYWPNRGRLPGPCRCRFPQWSPLHHPTKCTRDGPLGSCLRNSPCTLKGPKPRTGLQ